MTDHRKRAEEVMQPGLAGPIVREVLIDTIEAALLAVERETALRCAEIAGLRFDEVQDAIRREFGLDEGEKDE